MNATFTIVPQAAQVLPAIASMWKRALAILLDGCIVLVIAALPLAVIWLGSGEPFSFESGLFSTPTEDSSTGELTRGLLDAIVLLASWVLYRGLLTSRRGPWNGQTVGKRVCDLRITLPDGRAITPRVAWKRTALESLLLGSTGVLGATIDLVTGTPPTGTLAATAAGGVLFLIAIAPILRGQQRQTLYDRLAGTVVVLEPKVLPQVAYAPGAQGADAPATGEQVYSPLIAQPTVATPDGGATDPSGARRIEPRPVRGKTWAVVILSALLTVTGVAATPYLDDLQEWIEKADRIRAEPENKAAIAKLRTLEKLGETCLKASGSPERCDEAAELGARGMVFAREFDLQADPVGAHAGKIGALVEGDDVVFYAFTSADRTWSTIAGGGWLDRVCLQRDLEFCKDVPDW